MRKWLIAISTLIVLTIAPAIAAKQFIPYEKAKFDALLRSGQPVLVHVHADWCPTCRRQMALFDELLSDPAFKAIHTVRVNYDEDQDFLSAYRVRRQATIIAFKNGKEVARLIYDTDRDRIRAVIAAAL